MYTLYTHPDLQNLKIADSKKLLVRNWWNEQKMHADDEFLTNNLKDIKEIKKDTDYLFRFYENILEKIIPILNNIHSTNFNNRYWRILIGTYLYTMINTIFDRWGLIQEARKNYKIEKTIVKQYIESSFYFNDTLEILQNTENDYTFNHIIFNKILENHSDIEKIEIEPRIDFRKTFEASFKNVLYKKNISKRSKVSRVSLKIFIRKLLRFSTKNYFKYCPSFIKKLFTPNFLMLDISVPLEKQKYYYLSNGQFPWDLTTIWQKAYKERADQKINLSLRKKFLNDLNFEKFSTREQFIWKMIWTMMPTSFLENFKDLQLKSKSKIYSFKANHLILRSMDYLSDFQKILIAEKITKGSSIIIYQWRNDANMMDGLFFFKHDRDISDKYISFGWGESSDENIFPIGQFYTTKENTYKLNKNGSVLLVYHNPKEYNPEYILCNIDKTFTKKIIDFYNNLNTNIKLKTILRPNSSKNSKKVLEFFKKIFPNIKYDDKNDFSQLIHNCCICICNRPDTRVYFETLTKNIPTIIYFNPEELCLTNSALQDFNKLKDVGIFHTSPLSAAKQLNSILNNIPDWWYEEKLQKIRKEFCDKWFRISKDYGIFLKKLS